MNSTFNIGEAQKRVIEQEIRRGNDVMKLESESDGDINIWQKLTSNSLPNFLSSYPRYIKVTIIAPSSLFHSWFSWVESKVRRFVKFDG